MACLAQAWASRWPSCARATRTDAGRDCRRWLISCEAGRSNCPTGSVCTTSSTPKHRYSRCSRKPTHDRPTAMSGTELSVRHTSESRYLTRVQLAHHLAHLMPRVHEHQSVDQSELAIDPPPSDLHTGADAFGNVRSLFSIYAPHEQLRVEATSRLRVRDRYAGLDPAASPAWPQVR